MKIKGLIAAATLAAATIMSSPAHANRDYISIVGSSTVYPFATVVAEQFGKTTQFKTPKIESTGTGGGFKLFCGGIGTSVLYWGTIEWAHYYQAPPMGVEAGSAEALRWSMAYPIFHWGFTGWALYCLPAIAVAYAYHVRGVRSLTLSAACEPVIGRWAHRFPGRVIDMTYMIGLIGACSTGIGLAVPLIAACLGWMFGFEDNFALKVIVISVVTLVFFLPSCALGTISPVVAKMALEETDRARHGSVVGNIYAWAAAGSSCGGGDGISILGSNSAKSLRRPAS